MYVLNLEVGSLLQDFKVFEDLNNVHSWPISTLIQRELDHKRASLICKDYLLKDGDTKYFPPLIAVLIPTDEEYKPLETFQETSADEVNAVNTKYVKGEDYYSSNGYGAPKGIIGGITIIPLGEEGGDLVWDKNSVSAVIIDGQHRYKALQEAINIDKSYNDCLVAVTLVDLPDICGKSAKSPTEVARDLFVTINNTPIEVDETRLVLMDDKDVLSTFTQVLIDDSLEYSRPAIPPELIDWDCEGAKHDLSNSLSGVLVLRQIILSAMFDGSKVSTVEDRTNVRNVRKWKDKIEDWLSPDSQIIKELGNEESILYRFKLAEQEIKDNQDDEEEDSIFLFSYSTAVAKLLKKTFSTQLLSSFRLVFSELTPYVNLLDCANSHGVLVEDKPLNNYYRAFKGKRENLKKGDPELKKSIINYEKEFSNITEKSIPFTVMGQKSIFKALFDGFLSQADDISDAEYLGITTQFVSDFNDMYVTLCPAINTDENFFLTEFKMKRRKVSKAKSVGREFWKGIIIKYNGEIDYSRVAISILSQIIQDIIFYFYACDEEIQREKNSEEMQFQFTDHVKLIQRHVRLIRKLEFEEELTSDEQQNLAEKVVKSKEKELQRLLNL